MEMRPRTEQRLIKATTELNEITRAAAKRYDVLCLPVAGNEALRNPDTFSADGLHPSTAGHQTVARESAKYITENLGIEFDMERAEET